MDDDTYEFTEDGLLEAIGIHQQLLSGDTLEDIAAERGWDVLTVQVLMTLLYEMVDEFPDLCIVDVPDDLSALDD